MRALLTIGGLITALGIGLLVWGVRQQVAWSNCSGRPGCAEPESWPVTVGILILIGGSFLLVWTLAAGYASRALHPAPRELEERDRLQRVGVPGRAYVLDSEEAGISATGQELRDVQLSVDLPGREAYEVTHRAAIPRLQGIRLRRGSSIPVLVDPEDPNHLVVDWSLRALRARPAEDGRPGPGSET